MQLFSVLAKEIQLQHKAPVLDIQVLDAKGSVLTLEDSEAIKYFLEIIYANFHCFNQNNGVPALPHKVLICSEEQVKFFESVAKRTVKHFHISVQTVHLA